MNIYDIHSIYTIDHSNTLPLMFTCNSASLHILWTIILCWYVMLLSKIQHAWMRVIRKIWKFTCINNWIDWWKSVDLANMKIIQHKYDSSYQLHVKNIKFCQVTRSYWSSRLIFTYSLNNWNDGNPLADVIMFVLRYFTLL